MGDPVIRVKNLGKRYRVGQRERYLALRDVLANALKAPARLLAPGPGSANHQAQHIWALKDVSFNVAAGGVLGLIGRNGAGKTTLLKILARVTRPTEGFAEVRGRVGSLLEVGTGFHSELTGRENVFLSGAILGMKKKEIEGKFDDIVGFADVAKFIDTTLKYYSMGMQTRLAFAVAAHLEPQILLIDEVLAVGDIEFQKKCMGKMSEVAHGGRTILFVSHQMNQIRRLCQTCIWIDQGSIRRIGVTAEVANAYEKAATSAPPENFASNTERPQEPVRFVRWRVLEPRSSEEHKLIADGPVKFAFALQVYKSIRKGSLGIILRNADAQVVWACVESPVDLPPGMNQCEIAVPYLPLTPGPYYWEVAINDGHRWINEGQCFPELSVETRALMHPYDRFKGFLNIPHEFTVRSN